MLDAAKPVIGRAENGRVLGRDMASSRQGIERVTGPLAAQFAVAPAVDELVGLGEELDLANASAAQLDVVARRRGSGSALLFANAAGQLADRVDGPEIEAASPDEGSDMVEKALARSDIARA